MAPSYSRCRMPLVQFDATISLTAAHLVGTPFERHPLAAIDVVREEVEAIPGASWVSADYCGAVPGMPPLVGRLDLLSGQQDPAAEWRLRDAIEAAVEAALMSFPPPIETPATIVVPDIVREACREVVALSPRQIDAAARHAKLAAWSEREKRRRDWGRQEWKPW